MHLELLSLNNTTDDVYYMQRSYLSFILLAAEDERASHK